LAKEGREEVLGVLEKAGIRTIAPKISERSSVTTEIPYRSSSFSL